MIISKGRTIQTSGWRAGVYALAATMAVIAVQAPAGEPRFTFAIDAGPLQRGLVRFASVTDMQLLYSSAMVAGRSAPRLVGGFTPEAALARLLEGSGLSARRVGDKVFVLQSTPSKPAMRATPEAVAPVAPMADPPGTTPALATAGDARADASATIGDEARESANDIVVTGTHIRGRNPGSPPVTTITRDDLTRNGYATVAQALQALPGNFGGMATEQSSLAFADTSFSNASLSTGVDLRGLGAGATLVLVNGQRLGGSGSEGAFADVSAIPTGAVDRVEVLMDGASAIYGSDAVGGVVNILLKRNFDGAETRARLGSVTEGGKRDIQIDQTFGKQWSNGGFMLSYEYSRTGRLASADRPYAANSDSRRFGGTDHDSLFSLPGNVLGIDPTTGALGVAYAIPAGQNGTALKPPDFLAGVTNLQNTRIETDLIPRQIRNSAYATFDQDLSDTIHFLADARYSRRAFNAREPGSAAIVSIGASNPYFVSPSGASSDLIAYDLTPEIGPTDTYGYAEAMAYSAGLNADLGRDWKLRSYVAFAQERELAKSTHIANSAALDEASGAVPDDPATAFNTAVDGYFNPYGNGTSNSAAILNFVGDGFSISRTRSQILTGHVDADGSLFALPGGKVKLAVGGDVRRETFRSTGSELLFTDVPQALDTVAGARVIEAGFAELRVPVFSANNAMPGFRTLDLSAAGRVEHNGEYGTTTNPKIGLSWVPVAGLTLRTSYGTSFRAPNLYELRGREEYSLTTLTNSNGATVPVIQLSGGNPGLKPETARSWTAGFDLAPTFARRLEISGTWFRTVFSRQIGQPVNNDFANALIDPTLAPFVQFVSPATDAADLALVNKLISAPQFTGGTTFPATSVAAIVDNREVNSGKVDVGGVDLTLHYRLPVGANQLDLAASGTYLLHYREQVTPTSSSVEELDRVGEPVHLRGRLSLGWTRGIANALVGMNYVAPYHDFEGNRIGSWTTFDLQIGLTAPDKEGWLHGFEVSVVATNLFDKDPPFYDSPIGLGYDATNADALGRLVSLQLTKRW